MNKDKLYATEIEKITTSGSMYNKDILYVHDHKGNVYKMKIDEIFRFDCRFDLLSFNIKKGDKRNKWKYLEVDDELFP